MDISKKFNQTVQNYKSADIAGFGQRLAKIKGLIPLTLGEPDFNVPDHVKLAAIKAIINNDSHYTSPKGIRPLRVAISDFMKQKYGISYDPDTEITVTTGVTEGINATLRAILEPGDRVILPTPDFGDYMAEITLAGGKPTCLDVTDNDFILTPERLETAFTKYGDSIKAVILNSPNNPTGVVYNKEQLEGLAKVIKKHHVICVSDEIYSEINYDKPYVSMGQILPDQTIVFNGASKTFAMTGWRLGIACAPEKALNLINKVHRFTVVNPPEIAQYAALEAFKNGEDDGERMTAAYHQRRDLAWSGFDQYGFKCPKPKGAFYLFPKIPEQFTQNSFDFALQLAKEAKVGVIPGSIFGPGGEGHIRISYASSVSDIKEAIQRLGKFVKKHESK
ncbi:aminotransferase [Philodulcilactobacillus myokoensis]|uniref:Aminotransferase n=1 Tax=Philodulcilactobacillus myokoensis TaxID=2929573 RepID=A0A9W6B217_9LACO|nr:aminotransferase class I/II-fold pyridoxal phosphate-dependent enzyme [Philodulcilactobacillus myokoensis]GLB47494.1 aminotransferase [Philodulcilactobacillus myokoensis]